MTISKWIANWLLDIVFSYFLLVSLLVSYNLSLYIYRLTGWVLYRNTLFVILYILNPNTIIRQIKRMQLNKREYIIPSPDYI